MLAGRSLQFCCNQWDIPVGRNLNRMMALYHGKDGESMPPTTKDALLETVAMPEMVHSKQYHILRVDDALSEESYDDLWPKW